MYPPTSKCRRQLYPPAEFGAYMRHLGVNSDDHLVLYDRSPLAGMLFAAKFAHTVRVRIEPPFVSIKCQSRLCVILCAGVQCGDARIAIERRLAGVAAGTGAYRDGCSAADDAGDYVTCYATCRCTYVCAGQLAAG